VTRFPTLSFLEKEEIEDSARVAVAIEISQGRVKAKSDGEITSYVRTVITNAACDVWRRRRPGQELPLFLGGDGRSPLDRASIRDQLGCVENLVNSWSPENRFIFMMKLEQVTAGTIKRDLERLFGTFITTEAIDVRFFRLRSTLRRQCLGGDGDD
jgi:DNA-directed RNA polymerase specialized sigma24 family protein